jgi:hypothetical protein
MQQVWVLHELRRLLLNPQIIDGRQ